MEQIPEFWRTEVFHPLFVHFPIALLLMGTIFKFISLGSRGKFLSLPGTILLITGIIGGWAAIYTGNLADGIVSRIICDPTVLKDHQNSSYTMIWLFTAGVAIESIYQLGWLEYKPKLMKFLVLILLSVGCGFLAYTGHLGATLVYNQGAGVYSPSSDCNEFN